MASTFTITIEDEPQFRRAVTALTGPALDLLRETDATTMLQDTLLIHLAAALQTGEFVALSEDEIAEAAEYDQAA